MVVQQALVHHPHLALLLVFCLADIRNICSAGATQGRVQLPVGLPATQFTKPRCKQDINVLQTHPRISKFYTKLMPSDMYKNTSYVPIQQEEWQL
jgi:hypothetical protein